jgi:drug/metabolite transporter (DMT)-like permease
VIAAGIVLAVGEGLPNDRAIVYSVLAGIAGGLALGSFYRALAIGTMSIVAPISASGVTIPVVIGIATGDRPSSLQAAGLVVTFVGVLLASREVHEGETPSGSRASILLALVAAAGFGSYFVLSDQAADESVLWLVLIARLAAVVLLVAFVLATRTSVAMSQRDVRILIVIGAVDLAATGLYGLANTEGLLSVVSVVGALYPVVTVLLARLVLKERLRTVQAAGVLLAFTGVAAVAAGG